MSSHPTPSSHPSSCPELGSAGIQVSLLGWHTAGGGQEIPFPTGDGAGGAHTGAVSQECCQDGMEYWRHCQPQSCQLPAPGGTGLTGRALQQAVLPGDRMGLGPGNLAGGLGGAQSGKRRGGRMALLRNPYQQFNKT